MKQRPRPIHKKLQRATYEHDKIVRFKIGKDGNEQSQALTPVDIPLPLCFRLYHLGRAYDLPRIIALHPTGMAYMYYVQIPTLGLELELLAGIIDDPALVHYIDLLLALISNTRTDTSCSIVMKPE